MTEQLHLGLDAAADEPHEYDRAIPPDQASRDRIANDLSTTLFVEAGAGAGKTTALVGRIVALVADGVPITSIAAITFTEKAASELRHRTRETLAGACQSATGAAAERLRVAFDEVDHAPIGTLHAFARRLLQEFPVEAGLPPRFDVMDELASGVMFDDSWNDLRDELIEDPRNARLIDLLALDGWKLDRLRQVALDFRHNWDLVDERVNRERPPETSVDRHAFGRRLDDLLALPMPPDDTLTTKADELRRLRPVVVAAEHLDEWLHAMAPIVKALTSMNRLGNKKHWEAAGLGEEGRDAVREAAADAVATARDIDDALRRERHDLIGALFADHTLAAATTRRTTGSLEFHDLLVLARRLLTQHPVARRALHERYQRLLLDEFQDTDPIQLELAVLLTSDPGDSDPSRACPLPGRLFIVGDPKQSIYRFRRADIGQYLSARDRVRGQDVRLGANFRTAAPLISWINESMTKLIVESDGMQPPYRDLTAWRTGFHDHGTVTVLGLTPHGKMSGRGAADELRRREADDVVAAIRTALAEGWPVQTIGDDDRPCLVPCRPSDITVLVPTRLSLPALEEALRRADISYRAENSSLVYATAEVRQLLLALTAIDDPGNELALVEVLRTPLFGIGDDELAEWRVLLGGRLNLWAKHPEGHENHPVATALAELADLARRAPLGTPAELLDELARDRMVFELATRTGEYRDVWRRLRFVIDQARAWSEAGGRGVRRYLEWTELQGTDGRFVAETVLPETDHDAVRIMTIHAAKGLEFAITVVSGMTTKPMSRRGTSVVWPRTGWILADKDDSEYQEFVPLDQQMSDAERRRLLYVALTRARDHLVVSMHRFADVPEPARSATSAELLAWAAATSERSQPLDATDNGPTREPPRTEPMPFTDDVSWHDARHRALLMAGVGRTVSATRVAHDPLAEPSALIDPGLLKDAVDLELPPWQRGRYGTAVGRAVHAVLQSVDFDSDAEIPSLATAQAAAEGVLGMDGTVAALARSAWRAPSVRHASSHAHWREVYVGVPVGDLLLEGYVDLLMDDDDGKGLVIVDYKTDQLKNQRELAERVAMYARQVATYAVAIESVTGRLVTGGRLVFCRVDADATELEIPEWTAVVATVRDELSAAAASGGWASSEPPYG